jgi:hypothetical protein
VVPFLKEHLKAEAMTLDAKHVDRILKDLDDDSFATREKASAELMKMGPTVIPLLHDMMGKTNSLEAKHRLGVKLGEGKTVQQARRGLQILLSLPDKKARALVESICRQVPTTWLTVEARQALVLLPSANVGTKR